MQINDDGKLLWAKHEIKSGSCIVMFAGLEVDKVGEFRQFYTFDLGVDNENMDMYFEIVNVSKYVAFIFCYKYGNILYSGYDFKKAMAAKV
jgi:hypothetical protein